MRSGPVLICRDHCRAQRDQSVPRPAGDDTRGSRDGDGTVDRVIDRSRHGVCGRGCHPRQCEDECGAEDAQFGPQKRECFHGKKRAVQRRERNGMWRAKSPRQNQRAVQPAGDDGTSVAMALEYGFSVSWGKLKEIPDTHLLSGWMQK